MISSQTPMTTTTASRRTYWSVFIPKDQPITRYTTDTKQYIVLSNTVKTKARKYL